MWYNRSVVLKETFRLRQLYEQKKSAHLKGELFDAQDAFDVLTKAISILGR